MRTLEGYQNIESPIRSRRFDLEKLEFLVDKVNFTRDNYTMARAESRIMSRVINKMSN